MEAPSKQDDKEAGQESSGSAATDRQESSDQCRREGVQLSDGKGEEMRVFKSLQMSPISHVRA